MSANPEKRDNTRFDYQAPIVLEDAKFGVLQGARMFNYSDFSEYPIPPTRLIPIFMSATTP
jgi:hypothetical protein